ncbi:hypothetical protein V8G54_031069 [Vigna mungo]|uniref:Uncharacterized protein n=1 Tax=Vigna mungo TaxID=3915 RepID=A0AAQ3MXK2_VIGMU
MKHIKLIPLALFFSPLDDKKGYAVLDYALGKELDPFPSRKMLDILESEGVLKGFDQATNIILDEFHEKVYSIKQGYAVLDSALGKGLDPFLPHKMLDILQSEEENSDTSIGLR